MKLIESRQELLEVHPGTPIEVRWADQAQPEQCILARSGVMSDMCLAMSAENPSLIAGVLNNVGTAQGQIRVYILEGMNGQERDC